MKALISGRMKCSLVFVFLSLVVSVAVAIDWTYVLLAAAMASERVSPAVDTVLA